MAEDVLILDWRRKKRMYLDGKTSWFEKQVPKRRVLYQSFDNHYNHTDPAWQDGSQSYLVTGTANVNVAPAWRDGFHGEGTVVGVVDNGVITTQIDLRNQLREDLCIDVIENRTDPNPLHEVFSHGTNCAGVIAAEDNNFCGVGVAFKSKIAGIRIIDEFSGYLTDVMEATALGHKLQEIDIFSCSWGPAPADFIDGPAQVTTDLLKYATSEGRQGKGNIYVFATGNGGRMNISCSYNGYVNQPYVLGISGINGNGDIPSFSEACTAVFAVTYSREIGSSWKFVAPYRANRCSRTFFGESSAAAPVAAGVVALALSANPELTWRDVQHLIIRSSKTRDICNNTWKTNGAGHKVSDFCGFGLLDAGAMTKMASTWQTVPKQMNCTVPLHGQWAIGIDGLFAQLNISDESCGNVRIDSLEHVLVHVNTRYPKRGHLRILLTSPLGTTSTVVRGREDDVHPDLIGTFMTLHHWGETPVGTWHLEIQSLHPDIYHSGVLRDCSLTLFGTGELELEHPTAQDETTTPLNNNSNSKIDTSESTEPQTHNDLVVSNHQAILVFGALMVCFAVIIMIFQCVIFNAHRKSRRELSKFMLDTQWHCIGSRVTSPWYGNTLRQVSPSRQLQV
ncbi:furin-like isoform X2 [Branchiostoma floridae x Branchiostoma belcheri]